MQLFWVALYWPEENVSTILQFQKAIRMLCYVILWLLDLSSEILDLGRMVTIILSYLNMHAAETVV